MKLSSFLCICLATAASLCAGCVNDFGGGLDGFLGNNNPGTSSNSVSSPYKSQSCFNYEKYEMFHTEGGSMDIYNYYLVIHNNTIITNMKFDYGAQEINVYKITSKGKNNVKAKFIKTYYKEDKKDTLHYDAKRTKENVHIFMNSIRSGNSVEMNLNALEKGITTIQENLTLSHESPYKIYPKFIMKNF